MQNLVNSTERERFFKAYEEHAEAIYRHCYFRVYERERARELMQEAFVKTWEYITKGNQVENFRAFLYRVATNLVIAESKKRKKRAFSLDLLKEKGFDPQEDKSFSQIENVLDGRAAAEFIEKLKPKYRDVLVMRYLEELEIEEIAEILGERRNTVSVRAHRALEELRKIIKANTTTITDQSTQTT